MLLFSDSHASSFFFLPSFSLSCEYRDIKLALEKKGSQAPSEKKSPEKNSGSQIAEPKLQLQQRAPESEMEIFLQSVTQQK